MKSLKKGCKREKLVGVEAKRPMRMIDKKAKRTLIRKPSTHDAIWSNHPQRSKFIPQNCQNSNSQPQNRTPPPIKAHPDQVYDSDTIYIEASEDTVFNLPANPSKKPSCFQKDFARASQESLAKKCFYSPDSILLEQEEGQKPTKPPKSSGVTFRIDIDGMYTCLNRKEKSKKSPGREKESVKHVSPSSSKFRATNKSRFLGSQYSKNSQRNEHKKEDRSTIMRHFDEIKSDFSNKEMLRLAHLSDISTRSEFVHHCYCRRILT